MRIAKTTLAALIKSVSMVAIVAAGALTAATNAEAVSFNSTDNGWYNDLGSHTPTNTSIIAGGIAPNTFRNWFSFDLSTAAGQTVISAQLVIPAQGSYLTGGSTTSLTYDVNDYTGSIAALTGGTAGVAGYTDLGNGAYGQTVLNLPSSGVGFMSDIGPNVTVTLNASALADLNLLLAGAAYDFAVGGACSTCGANETIWRSTSGVPAAHLDLEFAPVTGEVPLPAALPLFASGLGAMALLAARRRKRKQAAA
jgi:hypothetical protein